MNVTDENYIPPEVCLDKCKCGGEPHFATMYIGGVYHQAHCLECGYATSNYPAQYQAMCEWNKRQRGVL